MIASWSRSFGSGSRCTEVGRSPSFSRLFHNPVWHDFSWWSFGTKAAAHDWRKEPIMRHTKRTLTDEQWERIAPHLPEHPPSPKGGRPRTDDRECLEGI